MRHRGIFLNVSPEYFFAKVFRGSFDLADNGESATEVFAYLWHKLWDRAKDDDDSENDGQAMLSDQYTIPRDGSYSCRKKTRKDSADLIY